MKTLVRWLAPLLSGSVVAAAADVSFMGVVKGVSHRQTGPTTVVLELNPYQFNTFVDVTGPGNVLAAAVTPAGRTTVPLVSEDDGWDLFAEFGSPSALETAYPNGNFTVGVTGKNDGVRSVTVSLTGDAYPSIPTLNGFSTLQGVTAGAPLALSWQPFAGGTALDFVQVSIEEDGPTGGTVFETGGPGQPDSLNGTHTSVTVPAAALAPGRSYRGRLLFARIVGMDTAYGQGVPAIAAYFRETVFSLTTTGTADTQAPQFWNAIPRADGGPAPRNSGVAFEFSEPMRNRQGIAWTGVDPANFTYRWSADGRVLFCLYATQLPASTLITWQLNPALFQDVAGNVLTFSPQGSFTTDAADASGTPDLKAAGLWKTEIFTQAPGASPQIRGKAGYGAGAFADSHGYNTLLGGELRLPGGGNIPLEYDQGESVGTEVEVNTKSEQDSLAPTGTYQLVIETVHQGTRTVALDLPPAAYPSVPEFLNLAAAQGFDPAQPLTLTWKPMAGGTVDDFIGLWVEPQQGGESVFETPEFLDRQKLNGTATAVTIPAGTMKAGRTYDVELEFAHPTTFDTTTVPGATLVVAYTRLTHATITAAGTVAPPAIRAVQDPDGRWRFRVTGENGVNYVLETVLQLGGGWTAIANFQIFGEAHEINDAMLNQQRFYRVREVSAEGP